MNFQIYFSGRIGSEAGELNGGWFRSACHEANGASIDITFNSGGGEVFQAFEMAKVIDEYPAPISANIIYAASAASFLACKADTVSVDDDSVMMMHFPWTIAGGNASDFKKTAEILDRLGDTLVRVYMQKSGRSEKEIRDMLEAETWLWGEEIQQEGFADLYTPSETAEDRNSLIASAKAKFAASYRAPTGQQVAALFGETNGGRIKSFYEWETEYQGNATVARVIAEARRKGKSPESQYAKLLVASGVTSMTDEERACAQMMGISEADWLKYAPK